MEVAVVPGTVVVEVGLLGIVVVGADLGIVVVGGVVVVLLEIVVGEGEGGLLEIAVEVVGLGIVVAPETVVEAVLGIAAVEADLETEADLEEVEDVLAETVAVVDTVED